MNISGESIEQQNKDDDEQAEQEAAVVHSGENLDESVEQNGLFKISPDEAKYIIMHTELTRDDRTEIYDSSALDRYGLAPKYGLNIDNIKIGISDIFFGREDCGRGGRPHAILYVEDGKGNFVARNFYKSNSQNSWRLLPGMDSNGRPGNYHYYKSPYGEQAINAPVELQKFLDELYVAKLDQSTDDSGTRSMPPEYIGAFRGDDEVDSFDHAFRSEIQEHSWAEYKEKRSGSRLTPPEELVLDSGDTPDLSRELMSWRDAEGNIKRVFASKDGKMKYEFLTDKKGRSCLALIECADAKMSSFGLRSQFVQTGDYTTPLYEYEGQTKGYDRGYGDLDDVRYPYYGMWRKYLSQAPFIRDYTDYLRDQGELVADYDDSVGQVEEDEIFRIGSKMRFGEPLSKTELEFICQPQEGFAYPESVKFQLWYIKRQLRLDELFDAGLDAETIATNKGINTSNFEEYLRHGVDPKQVFDLLDKWKAAAYFDVFLKYDENLDASQLELNPADLDNRNIEDQRKAVAALLDHGVKPENLSLDDYPEYTLELVEILKAHNVPVDVDDLTGEILDQIYDELGDYDETYIIGDIARKFSRLVEIGADQDRLSKAALEVFQTINEYRQEDGES